MTTLDEDLLLGLLERRRAREVAAGPPTAAYNSPGDVPHDAADGDRHWAHRTAQAEGRAAGRAGVSENDGPYTAGTIAYGAWYCACWSVHNPPRHGPAQLGLFA